MQVSSEHHHHPRACGSDGLAAAREVITTEVSNPLGERGRGEEIAEGIDAWMIKPALGRPDLHDVCFKGQKAKPECPGRSLRGDRRATERGGDTSGIEVSCGAGPRWHGCDAGSDPRPFQRLLAGRRRITLHEWQIATQ